MEHIIRILKERLVGKGMAAGTIPAYIRDLTGIIEGNGCSSFEGVLNPDNMDSKSQAREANHESKMQASL